MRPRQRGFSEQHEVQVLAGASRLQRELNRRQRSHVGVPMRGAGDRFLSSASRIAATRVGYDMAAIPVRRVFDWWIITLY